MDLKISDAADPVTLLTTDRFPIARAGSTTAYAGSVEEIANFVADTIYRGVWRPGTNSPNIAGGDPLDGAYYIAVTIDPTVPEQVPAGVPGLAGLMIRNGDRLIWATALSVWQRLPGGTLADPLTVQFSTMNGINVAALGFNCYASAGTWHSVSPGPVATIMLNSAANTLQTWQGTASGANVAPTFTATMSIDTAGNVSSLGDLRSLGSRVMSQGNGNLPSVVCMDLAGAGYAAGMWVTAAGDALILGQTDGGGVAASQFAILTYPGDLTIAGTGYKPGGGPWIASSDDRVKKNVQPYTSGLAEVIALQPISYQYNGEGGTVDDGRQYVGLSAQATQPVMPELVVAVPQNEKTLPGQLGTDLGPLLLAVCNGLRELAERVAALETA